jgi:two-component system, LytTR family, sensor histidine kinase LytS
LQHRIQGRADGTSPVSVHFVNNVLAAAASYIEEEPETARDVLAELGSFLSHRLRGPRLVSTSEELEHVAVYLRLEQARFPERVDFELPASADLPAVQLAPGEVQAPLGDALGRWMAREPGRVRVALRARADGLDLQLDHPDEPGEAGERLHIGLGVQTTESVT